MLYVRTEKRPGADAASHLFAVTHGRVIFERWLPEGADLPPELELALDPEAQKRAAEAEAAVTWVEQERDALLKVIRDALPLVPEVTKNVMRAAYREAMSA